MKKLLDSKLRWHYMQRIQYLIWFPILTRKDLAEICDFINKKVQERTSK